MTIRLLVLICMTVVLNGKTALEYSNNVNEYVIVYIHLNWEHKNTKKLLIILQFVQKYCKNVPLLLQYDDYRIGKPCLDIQSAYSDYG